MQRQAEGQEMYFNDLFPRLHFRDIVSSLQMTKMRNASDLLRGDLQNVTLTVK